MQKVYQSLTVFTVWQHFDKKYSKLCAKRGAEYSAPLKTQYIKIKWQVT